MVNKIVLLIRYARTYAINHHVALSFCPVVKLSNSAWKGGVLSLVREDTDLRLRTIRIPPQFHVNWQSSLRRNSCLYWQGNGFLDGQQGHFLVSFSYHHELLVRRVNVSSNGDVRVLL